MGLFLTVFWWLAVNSGNSRFGGFYSRLGPQEFPFNLLRELAHMALIRLVVAVRKRHLVGTIEKIPGSTGITGNPVMAARSKAMSIAGACARKRWFRQTHSFAEHAQELCILVEDTDVGSPPQSNPSKPAGLAPMVAIRASLVCGRSIPGGFGRSAPCAKPLISSECARPACWKSDRNVRQSEWRLDRLWRWPPVAWKFWGSSQRSNADLSAGHSLSRIENQQVLRLRRL